MAEKKIKYNEKEKNGNVLLLLFDFNKSTCLFSTDESILVFTVQLLNSEFMPFFLLIRRIPHKQPPCKDGRYRNVRN